MNSETDLKKHKKSPSQKQFKLHEEIHDRNLLHIIEQKDHEIRKLKKKINKLQQTLRKHIAESSKSHDNLAQSADQDIHIELFKAEIEKAKKYEEILQEITTRVGIILQDMSHDNSMTDNSEELKEMLMMLSHSKNSSFQSQLQSGFSKQINIEQDWSRKMDILEGAFKSFKNKFVAIKGQNIKMRQELGIANKTVQELSKKPKESEQMRLLKEELKQERKQRVQLRLLLDKTQYDKNQLINKINGIGNTVQMKAKTKEELLQYSKELNYRVKDLQKQKQDILKEANKQKDLQLKKYQLFLKRLKIIKQKSRCGKSFA